MVRTSTPITVFAVSSGRGSAATIPTISIVMGTRVSHPERPMSCSRGMAIKIRTTSLTLSFAWKIIDTPV